MSNYLRLLSFVYKNFHMVPNGNTDRFSPSVPPSKPQHHGVKMGPSYPSGSMTLPKPAVKKHASPTNTVSTDTKVTFKGLPPVEPSVKKPITEESGPAITKPNESGESDPGYESDSSKSKTSPHEDQQQQQQQQQKACTLPRRSAKVSVQPSSSTLDRRKLRSLAESEAGVTVEIISPIRVRFGTIHLLINSGECKL